MAPRASSSLAGLRPDLKAMDPADLPELHELFFAWNGPRPDRPGPRRPILVHDETLRDGLQGASAVDPTIEAKRRILELMEAVGVGSCNLGLPGAGPRAVEHVTALAAHIRNEGLHLSPAAAARTHPADIGAVVECAQASGVAIEVMAFVGTSPIRRFVETWDLAHLRRLTREAIELAVREGLKITFVTEDTIRTDPETLAPLFREALDAGAHRLCLCDTVGHATRSGVRRLVEFALEVVQASGCDAGLDWHGHNDRGLALSNALHAVDCGVDRPHGTVLGVGERAGNPALDLLLVNLVLGGDLDTDLTSLPELCRTVAAAMDWSLAANHPVVGADVFRTATGVHAAAQLKARAHGGTWLEERLYSAVPAAMVGRRHRIEVGPMSGLSNVRSWLAEHGYEEHEGLPQAILAHAKERDRRFTDAELRGLVARLREEPRTSGDRRDE